MWKRLILPFLLSFTLIFLITGIAVILSQYLIGKFNRAPGDQPLPDQQTALSSAPPSLVPGLIPSTLLIPKLNIQAAVEKVGLTKDNYMDVPVNAANVAWYMYGPKPSEPGSAVIAGHFDTPSGRPAIFYQLNKLKLGDEVEIVSENAIHSKFVVTNIENVPYDKFPEEKIFLNHEGKNLYLITCGGIWDPAKQTYSNRIIVSTSLVTEESESL